MSKKALRLLELGLRPVLLGRSGDRLKRPLQESWQTAVPGKTEVARWPKANNVGIRCGWQPGGRALVVFDFDEEAERLFPVWREQAAVMLRRPLTIVASGRGYHVYFYTETAQPGRVLAGRYGEANGRTRLFKFIETLGERRQVVAAGSRHPAGRRYRFVEEAGYGDIPLISGNLYAQLTALAAVHDERPPRVRRRAARPVVAAAELAELGDCLSYARRFLGAGEQVERNGDIRFLGLGGLLVTADGRGWYSFSDEVGGGLAELIAWHRRMG
jgi:hypothetical protein